MNKTAIVTGGASGIGRAVVILLFNEGYHVVIADSNSQMADDLADELCVKASSDDLAKKRNERTTNKVISVVTEVTDEQSVIDMVRKTISTFNKIHVLVHCVGIQKELAFEDTTLDEWRKIIDVNLTGTFLCCKHVSAEMIKSKGGKIVNLTSVHDRIPRKDKFSYDASKAGISMFTKELALQLAPYKINVNAVAPGAIITPMNQAKMDDEKQLRKIRKRIPWKRMGEANEVAELVLFLVSAKAEYITGEIITIDGGRSLN